MALINPIAIIKKWANGTTSATDVVLPPITTSTTVANQETGFPPSQEQDPCIHLECLRSGHQVYSSSY